MRAAKRSTLTVLLLTVLGIIPPANAENVVQRARSAHAQVFPEDAPVIDAIKQVHDDIRAGRLGH